MITDVLKRYNFKKESGSIRSLESIITSRIHTYHDEFENLKRMILYIFKKILKVSKLNMGKLKRKDFFFICFQSRSFYRAIKNTNWEEFEKLAERDGVKVFRGIFNKVRQIILMDLTPRERNSLLIKYLHYLQNKKDYKIRILRTISGYPVHDLQDYLKKLELKIDELWDKYNRVKRDAFSKIAKKLMYYCLYYKVKTITIGYNKGWQNQRNKKVKLNILTRDLFLSLPFGQMFERIQVEAIYFGIDVDYTPEWYTSKC